jgi:hypothetical protein
MWRRLVRSKRRMAISAVVAALLICWVGAAVHYFWNLPVRAEGVLNPLDPRQVKVRPEDWRVEASMSKADAKRLRRPAGAGGELDVDILLASEPTQKFRGKVAVPAVAVENDKGENVPVQVRIHPIEGDIPGKLCVPSGLLVAGTSVRVRFRAN